MNTVCTYVRILNHLGKIVEGLDERESLPTADSGDQFTPHISTYLKLLLTMSYARNATLKIGPKFTEKLYFLDILSASGLTYPGGATQPLPGSCFAVPLAYQEFSRPRTPPSASFSKSWAFELDSKGLAHEFTRLSPRLVR